MAGIVDQIKERVDIVDLISSYLKLQKSGINYKARCPFHNEKTASFFVSPERQIWHCFGCNLGGDAFGFVKQIDGVEFPEALRILANRAGVELKRQSPEYQEFQSAKTKLYEICELAMRFFEKQLRESSLGKQALTYLHERGLTDESIKEFHLGYAPESWSALYDFLGRNYSNSEIFNAGLIVKKDSGGFFDRFRSRIIFPIFDLNSQVVGFSARIFEPEAGSRDPEAAPAKYVNSPQTPIYDKSRILYGLDKAKLDIRRANKCLVVEGNMDVIMSHQAGAKHVIASSGTALTDGHLKIIKRYTDNLDLCFDSDSAGTMATDRGVDLALARGFNVGIVTIESPRVSASVGQRLSASSPRVSAPLKDPADYVKIYGAKWAEVSQNSQPFLEFYFKTTQKLFDIATALGKKMIAQKLVPFLAAMANKIEQAHWVSELAIILKTKEGVIYEEMAKIRPKETGEDVGTTDSQTPTPQSPTALDPQEEAVLSLIIKKPDLVENITPDTEQYFSEQLKKLLPVLNKKEPEATLAISGDPSLQLTAYSLQPNILDFIYLKSQELWKDFRDTELHDEFGKLINQIKTRKIKEKLANIEYDIKIAQKNQDKTKQDKLLNEFNSLAKKLP